jgi:hypothetical protein
MTEFCVNVGYTGIDLLNKMEDAQAVLHFAFLCAAPNAGKPAQAQIYAPFEGFEMGGVDVVAE